MTPANELEKPAEVARTRQRRLSPKWLILLIFAPGLLCYQVGLPGASLTMVYIHFVSFCGCALLLTQLSQPLKITLWCWCMLFVFIAGYYVKFLLYSAWVGAGILGAANRELGWVNYEDLAQALFWSALGFNVFCLVSTLLLRPRHRQIRPMVPTQVVATYAKSRLLLLLYVTSILATISTVLPPLLGFGAMGMESTGLPYHVDAVITRFRLELAPCIFLLILWLADKGNVRSIQRTTLSCLVLLAATDAVIRSSRGSLYVFLLPVAFLAIISENFNRGRRMFIFTAIVASFLLYPVISAQRGIRMESGATAVGAMSSGFDEFGTLRGMSMAFDNMSSRVSGLDGVLHIVRYERPAFSNAITNFDPARVFWLLDAETLAAYNTEKVVGISRAVEGRPPTFVGGFLIVGGPGGLIIFVGLYTTLVWLVWNRLVPTTTGPVTLAFFAGALVFWVSEGSFGLQDPLTFGITLVAIKFILNWVGVRWKSAPRDTSDQRMKGVNAQ